MIENLKRFLFTSVLAFLALRFLRKLYQSKSKRLLVDSSQVFLQKSEKKPVTLVKRTDLSHDSAILHFSLDTKSRILGLPVGKHFKVVLPNQKGAVEGEWNGRPDAESSKSEIFRSYTPISGDEHLGKLDLLVKFYRPKDKVQFPDGGKVSRQLDLLKIGDEIKIQGPFGRVEYLGKGKFKIGSRTEQVTEVGMMAGGSGLTPMLQIVRYSLKDPQDKTKFSLIYANQTEDDILLRSELEDLAKDFPKRFRVHFTLDRPPKSGWRYSSGFITQEMISEILPAKESNPLILMCGPPPMVKFACRANLDALNYPKNMQVEF